MPKPADTQPAIQSATAQREGSSALPMPKKRGSRAEKRSIACTPKVMTSLPTIRRGTKQALLIDLLKRKKGATIDEAVEATGWQPHSVRGAISGTLKKRLGLLVTSDPAGKRGRVYRIVERA